MEKKKQKISNATMSRFPIYLKALRKMQLEGKENFLSSELSDATSILDTTIRRDFSFLAGDETLGRRGIGYRVEDIINALNKILGLGSDEPIILVGVGNLGRAILKYNRWQYTVGKIVAGYDKDPYIEGEVFGVKLYNVNDLEKTLPEGCKIAILAISEDVQETVDRLMDAGIVGIVDFTHTHFRVKPGVEVEPVDIVVAVQELVLRLNLHKIEENL